MGWNGGGDRVAKRSARVHPDSLGNLFDLNTLRARATEVSSDPQMSESDRKVISEFLDAWARADSKDDSD